MTITKLKAYKILECAQINAISKKLFLSIKKQIDISVRHSSAWHFLDTKEILKGNSELVDFFNNLKLFPKHSAATIIYDDNDLPLHVDAEPVVAKINFPVLNTENWINTWYVTENSVWEKCPYTVDQFGNKKKDISMITKDQFCHFASLSGMNYPIVFNSQIPHAVKKTDIGETPRIVASFTFFNEPLEYLR